MTPCKTYFTLGYDPQQNVSIVTDEELANPFFINDVLNYAQELRIRPCHWRDYLTDSYANFEGRIIDASGEEVFLDMDVFEIEEDILFANDNDDGNKDVTAAHDAIRDWFDYWLCKPMPRFSGNLSKLDKERLRVVGAILRATHPNEATLWGLQSKAANDNKS